MRRRNELWLGVLLTAAVGCVAATAQREAPEAWPQIGFDITVLDAQDAPVPDFAASQISVREDGKPVAKFDLLPAGDEPQSICILVDMSGSTFSDRDVIRRSILKLIDDLPGKDEVCLVDFSNVAYVDAPLTMDRKMVRQAVNQMRIGGGSSIYDSIFSTVNYVVKNAKFRSRAIIVLSDGDDNVSKETPDDVLKLLRPAGAPVVYTIDNHASKGHQEVDGHGRRWLEKMADESGGISWVAKGDAGVDATVSTLVRALEHRYRLILTTAAPQDGSAHRLDVTLNKDLRKQKISVNATRGFDGTLWTDGT
jgi:VWFA-related protein